MLETNLLVLIGLVNDSVQNRVASIVESDVPSPNIA